MLATVAPCMTSTWLVQLTIRFVLAICFVAHLVAPFTRLATLAAHLVTHFVARLVLIRLAVLYFVHTVFSSVAVATAVYSLFMTVAPSVVTRSRTTVTLVALKHIP